MNRWNKDPGHEKMDQGSLSQKMEQGTYDTRRWSKEPQPREDGARQPCHEMMEQRFVSGDDGARTPATRRRKGQPCKEKTEQGSLSREDGIRTPRYEKMEQDSSVTKR